MKRIGQFIAVTLLATSINAEKNKNKKEKGWKEARDHWNPNQVKHDTEAGIALIGNTKIMLPGAIRREAAQEAAKRNKEKMEECKKKVCKSDCQPDDKSVGCKYCVLKTCLKRAPKAGTKSFENDF